MPNRDTTPYYKSKPSLQGKLLHENKGGGNIYYIRHGSTKLNSADKIRGWKDIPLDEEGRTEAHKLGKQLKGKIDCIISGDLKRTHDTAKIISDETGVKIEEVTKNLRPWNLGIFSGQDVKETLPQLKHYAKDMPNTPVPEGESFNTFKKRYIQEVTKIINQYPGQNVALVSHHRGDRVLDAWEKDGKPSDFDVKEEVFFTKGMEPGTYRVIAMDRLKT